MNQIDFRQDLLPLKDKIYRLALRITLNRQEAEDLTQDTLLRAWDKRVELCAVQSLEAYCLTIVRRLALDRLALKEAAEPASLNWPKRPAPSSTLQATSNTMTPRKPSAKASSSPTAATSAQNTPS